MLHYPKQDGLVIPFDVNLFSGASAVTGLTGNIPTISFLCLDTDKLLDFNDNTFKNTPTDGSNNTTESSRAAGRYFYEQDVSDWDRGSYRATITYPATGDKYISDFSIGIKSERRLGYSAAYATGVLTLSVWVEEDGVTMTDYTGLTDAKLYNSAGSVVASGWTPTESNGIWKFQQTVALAAGSNYIFECSATCPSAGGDLSYKLRVGLARP